MELHRREARAAQGVHLPGLGVPAHLHDADPVDLDLVADRRRRRRCCRSRPARGRRTDRSPAARPGWAAAGGAGQAEPALSTWWLRHTASEAADVPPAAASSADRRWAIFGCAAICGSPGPGPSTTRSYLSSRRARRSAAPSPRVRATGVARPSMAVKVSSASTIRACSTGAASALPRAERVASVPSQKSAMPLVALHAARHGPPGACRSRWCPPVGGSSAASSPASLGPGLGGLGGRVGVADQGGADADPHPAAGVDVGGADEDRGVELAVAAGVRGRSGRRRRCSSRGPRGSYRRSPGRRSPAGCR